MTKLKILMALLLVLLPEGLVRRIIGRRRAVVAGRTADPKAQAVGELVALVRAAGAPPTVAESRAQLAGFVEKFDAPGPAGVRRLDTTLPGAEGPRAARVYLPSKGGDDPLPTLLYLHGGGWIQGSIETHDALCAKLAEWAGIRVISYDYRLAPEDKFPAAPQDVMAAYRALTDPDGEWRHDPARLAVGGDSAGANLAASLLHSLAAEGGPMPRAQVLLYPGVDGRLSSQSMQDLHDSPLLPVARMNWYLDLYLPDSQDRLAPEVSPLFSPSLAGQPAALVLAAGHDPLWDDGLGYAEALQKAGVEAALLTYPGQVHGFLNLTKIVPQGTDAIRQVADWLGQALAQDA